MCFYDEDYDWTAEDHRECSKPMIAAKINPEARAIAEKIVAVKLKGPLNISEWAKQLARDVCKATD